MDSEEIFTAIGKLTVFVVPVGAALIWLARIYIDRWISSRFQKQLDELKHTQNQEIEKLRAKTSAALNRIAQLHQHEFEVLPKAWDLLSVAYASTQTVLSAFQRIPDVQYRSIEELKVILDGSGFLEHEKDEIISADGLSRQDAYLKYHILQNLREALSNHSEFQRFIVLKGIFVEPVLQQKMLDLGALMWECLDEHRELSALPNGQLRDFQKNRDKWKNAAGMRDDIRNRISERLWAEAEI